MRRALSLSKASLGLTLLLALGLGRRSSRHVGGEATGTAELPARAPERSNGTEIARASGPEPKPESERPEPSRDQAPPAPPLRIGPTPTLEKAEDEKPAPAWRALWRLRRFMFPHWLALVFGFVLLLGIAALDLLKPWPLKFVIDDVLTRQSFEGRTMYLLLGVVGAVVAIELFGGLMSYLLVRFLNRAGRTIVFELRAALFDQIQRLSLQFHSRRSTGDLLTRVTSDAKAVRDVLTTSIAELLTSLIFLIGMAVVLLILDWQLALVVIGAAPVLFLLLRRFSLRIREHSRAERAREGALASVAHETLGTIRLSRIFNREEDARARFQAESEASLESGFAAAITEERFSWVVDVLTALVAGTVLWFGVQRVMAGAITVGTLIVFLSYTRNFYKPIRMAIKQGNRISRAAARMERVADLLDLEGGVQNFPGARPASRFSGRIEFENVSFGYEPARPTLIGVDLVIPAGRVTAIVGPTGAGKSSLVSLVPRLYDPVEGVVRVDGQDVRRFTLDSLRSQVSMVLQESVLLSASIRENIAYGRPSARFPEIVAAAEAAHAHEFISALPDGYEAVVGERGETLSGGQRQRIAIARAILRNAPIVILDEPLVGLDATSATIVMDALEPLMEGRTLIIIAHDLSLVRRADHVVVIADGRIAEEGSQSQLLARDSVYRRMVVEAKFRDLSVSSR